MWYLFLRAEEASKFNFRDVVVRLATSIPTEYCEVTIRWRKNKDKPMVYECTGLTHLYLRTLSTQSFFSIVLCEELDASGEQWYSRVDCNSSARRYNELWTCDIFYKNLNTLTLEVRCSLSRSVDTYHDDIKLGQIRF